MDALACLMTRRTATRLVEPGPTVEQIMIMLGAATTAPDHKMLRPWRFVVVRSDARATLAAAIKRAAEALGGLPEPVIRKTAGKATRSPALIAVVASRVGSKVPVAEQDASAAAAAQNICLAAHALGVASAWKSVPMQDSAEVRGAFGLTSDEVLVGWVELGTQADTAPLPARPAVRLAQVATEMEVDGTLVPVAADDRISQFGQVTTV
ncbi:nitroreductase [Frankia sp. CcI156]|uniref:Putative NAD(P)H nitroreductase n=2 Tax=Frankia casuarinae (strain DSM 45818 / CECT 9043 / HFP020203 / CcI3) TaxID=106370 RepID=Q2JGZ8_FRACC|nr:MULTISPECIES: nitroreductase [Frankia]ABD09444.1 nitroreductase [Frankia casuarinae]ETA02772.1 nitroreductase [Frankia sp. CcI6]EYT94155.1 nitroreductase [Frankia casuarinae]KDA44345.1 nitroreductase [Frankia sp. BMG5.23]OFB42303.1 nitroreductase [Frankia sp. CgIM4]